MGLFGKLLDILIPPRCELCGENGTKGEELCDSCRAKFVRECFEHCPVCGKTAQNCTCGTDFTDVTHRTVGGKSFFSLTFYKSEKSFGESDRATEKLIFALKERGAFARMFATEICRGLGRIFSDGDEDITEWIITYPPRSDRNFYKYGIDQSETLASEMAKILGCRTARTLARGSRSVEQKTLSARERKTNAESTLIPLRNRIEDGGKYILVDDIITSGATVKTAAELLYSCGAATVFPVSVARTVHPSEIIETDE